MNLIYVLEYLLKGQLSRTFLKPVDAATGSILEEVGESDDPIMRGVTLQGKEIKLPISSILKIEEYTVGHRTNKGVRREDVSADKLDRIIDQNTDRTTGEVKNISYIQDRSDPNNGVEQKPKGWPW